MTILCPSSCNLLRKAMNGVSSYTSQTKRSAESTNSILELGLAVAHIPRARCTCGVAARLPEAEGRAPKGAQAAARVAEGDALAGVLDRFPIGRDHPQGYAPNIVSHNAGTSGLRIAHSKLQLTISSQIVQGFSNVAPFV